MSWIQTWMGRKFDFTDLMEGSMPPGVIHPIDITMALSQQTRFNGHTRVPYTIAEHSVRVMREVPPEARAYALLHDAAEAYIGDVVAPIKNRLSYLKALEEETLALVWKRFDLEVPTQEILTQVELADRRLLMTEARDLMGSAPGPWGYGDVDPLPDALYTHTSEAARDLFWHWLEELGLVKKYAYPAMQIALEHRLSNHGLWTLYHEARNVEDDTPGSWACAYQKLEFENRYQRVTRVVPSLAAPLEGTEPLAKDDI